MRNATGCWGRHGSNGGFVASTPLEVQVAPTLFLFSVTSSSLVEARQTECACRHASSLHGDRWAFRAPGDGGTIF
jgi:hypothetical protein